MALPGIRNAIVVPVQLVDEACAIGIVIEVRISADRRHRRERPPAARSCRAVAHRKPLVTDPQMLADAEAQSLLPRRFPPDSHDVLLRSHVHRVPARILRVPQVEVIVVHAHADEVLCAGLLVEAHQMVGIPTGGLPDIDQILVANLGRMPIVFQMMLILLRSLDIHVARVPVAVFNGRLRPPMRPDAELGIAEPFRNPVSLQGVPGSDKAPTLRRLSFCESRESKG